VMITLKGALAIIGSCITLGRAFAADPEISASAEPDFRASSIVRSDFGVDDPNNGALTSEDQGAGPRSTVVSVPPELVITEPAKPIR